MTLADLTKEVHTLLVNGHLASLTLVALQRGKGRGGEGRGGRGGEGRGGERREGRGGEGRGGEGRGEEGGEGRGGEGRGEEGGEGHYVVLQDTLALRLPGPPHLPPQPPYPVITDGTVGIGKASRDKSMAIDSFDLLPPLGPTALVDVPYRTGGEMTQTHRHTHKCESC